MMVPKILTVGVPLVLLPILATCTAPDANEVPANVPTFQADANWPVLPADFEWGQVLGIATDSRGHVWTSSRSEIAEWDPRGNLVQSWNAAGPDRSWQVIHGLFVDHNNFVWTNARESNLTLKFTQEGEHVLTIGRLDETGGSNLGPIKIELTQRRQPREVCQTRVGDLALTDPEFLQRRQPREMGQARVGDLSVVEPEHLQVGHLLQMHQPCVGDLAATKVEPL